MLKIKLYFILTIFTALLISTATAVISIKVAAYRGEQIDELSKQIEEINNRTEKYDSILTDYLESKNENRKIYDNLKKTLDSCSNDVYLPNEFNRLWESFAASQTCDSGSVNERL